MFLNFYLALEKTAIDLRKTQNLSRAQMPGIKLLANTNTGKPIKPVFNTQPLSSPGAPKMNPNFPYQKPSYKGGLRDLGVNKPSATINMQS